MTTETTTETIVACPLTPPAGCPSYVTKSVQQHCDQALNAALRGEKYEYIVAQRDQRRESELRTTREVVNAVAAGKVVQPNGVPLEQDWWLRWGYQTVTRAWEDAAQLARFRDALAAPDFSHVTHGHTVNPNSYHVYRVDRRSPSGCMLVASAAHELPGAAIVLAASGKHATQGACRGDSAARRAMTGG
jgi:hypothetical protein